MVSYIHAPTHTWNIHLQAHDDLLMVVNARHEGVAEVLK